VLRANAMVLACAGKDWVCSGVLIVALNPIRRTQYLGPCLLAVSG
jgi:hypothetical protein